MKKTFLAVLILAVAVVSYWTGGRYGKEPTAGIDSMSGRKVLYYIDPMTPGFRSDKPGIAPCGMPLEPVYADTNVEQLFSDINSKSAAPGAVRISPDRQQLIGIKLALVVEETMSYTLRLYGRVFSDETGIYRINASTDCWIRELSDFTTGSIVEKDQILAEALAPAYYNAQLTYLIALDNLDRIKRQLGGQLRHQQADLADNQIRVAVQALQNLGITDAQTEELANTRKARPYLQVRSPTRGVVLSRNITLNQWFKAAEEFYTIADIGSVWVYADVYEDEAMHLAPGMKVGIWHPHMGRAFAARVSEVLPLFDPVAKTLKVRLDVENTGYDLRPDMFVDVEIPITLPPSIHVPADAVIDSGTRKIVYVDAGGGIFEPRRVRTGWRLGRHVEITEGLSTGENVVVSGNFLIDSESRMKTAAWGYADEDEDVKEPEKAIGKVHLKVGRSWADLLQVGRDGRKGGTMIRSAKNPGIIDWDGPEKEGEKPDWSGWGAFPGAEYLGLKHRFQKPTGEQVSDKPEAPDGDTHAVGTVSAPAAGNFEKSEARFEQGQPESAPMTSNEQ